MIHAIFIITIAIRRKYHQILFIARDLHFKPDIGNDIELLEKLPVHLSVIIPTNTLKQSLKDVRNICQWSLAVGITQLSVYESTGILKQNLTQVKHAVHAIAKANVRIPNTPRHEFCDIDLTLLSEEDGRESIVDMAKTLSDLVRLKKLKSEDIDVLLIDPQLEDLIVTEPDMVLAFLPRLSLQGYPPWHIRLSEIYYEQDCTTVNYHTFIEGLKAYSLAEMRLGT